MVSLTLTLLLSPMLLLFLADLSKWQSSLVVILFGIVATTGMSVVHHGRSGNVFLAITAYMAILVTFLANLQGGRANAVE